MVWWTEVGVSRVEMWRGVGDGGLDTDLCTLGISSHHQGRPRASSITSPESGLRGWVRSVVSAGNKTAADLAAKIEDRSKQKPPDVSDTRP